MKINDTGFQTFHTASTGSRMEVDSYLGHLRIRYSGDGRLDVFVDESADFEPSDSAFVGSLSSSGVLFVPCESGGRLFVRAIQTVGSKRHTSDPLEVTVNPVRWPDEIAVGPLHTHGEVA